LLRVPENTSTRYHRYVIASNLMFVFALAGHGAFIPIYSQLGMFVPLVVNVIAVPIDGWCLYLNNRGRYAEAFALWVTLVILHTIVSSLTFGWDSGFHYYLLSLVVFVFFAPWQRRVALFLLILLMGTYVWLNLYLRSAAPIAGLSAGMISGTNLLNILVNFIILAYLTAYYALASEKTHTALEESEKTLKTTLAASPVGIALIRKKRLFWANDAFFQMLACSESEALQHKLSRFFPNTEDLERILFLIYSSGKSAVDLFDTEIVRLDGSKLPCHIKIRPIVPNNESMGSIVVVIDISGQKTVEREKAELMAKVQRAEKMETVGTLAGGVAHDLNNILSGILSYPELLLLNLPPGDPLRGPLEIIKQSGEKAAAIVHDLLTLARRGVPVRNGVDLKKVIGDYRDSPEQAQVQFYHPGVEFEFTAAAAPACVMGSEIHFFKTVMNLVANASEAIVQEGIVRVTTALRVLTATYRGYELIPPGDYVVLSVSDNGQGISDENLERIFEPFYTKKVMGRSGTGLGLAVVWGTVKDCGGFMDVISSPDMGTRFDLYLPRGGEKALRPVAQASLDNFRGSGQHVLVVDDMEEQRIIATSMLRQLGYWVDAVASGEAAVAWARENASDVMLMDMVMDPGIDGLEAFQRIAVCRPGQKVIIASGYAESERIRQALAQPNTAYLKKPYTLVEMARVVHKMLASPAVLPGDGM
jgi:PAS domain S-box-containing protein